MSYKTQPFVKWAGGKRQLLSKLLEHLPFSFNKYYEPFIGGGALFLGVQPTNAVINDNNAQLINVYNQIKKNGQELIEEICLLDAQTCDKNKYLELRRRYNDKIINHQLDMECAALMIWLNKHCFNGLYRVNSKGLFNVPYNNRKNGSSIDVENIKIISRYLNSANIDIQVGDFEVACEGVQSGDFVYFDSPYVPVSSTAYFTDYTKDGFTFEDHVRLSELFKRLTNIGAKVMLSNHDVPLVHELYDGFNIETIKVRRAINSNASKRKGTEVIITNY